MPEKLPRPEGVGPAGIEAWTEAISTLEAIGERPELSIGSINRYARLVDDAELVRKRWIAMRRPTKAAGSQGQNVVHPMLKALRDAEEAAAVAGDRLGLNPAARTKAKRGIGRPKGNLTPSDGRPGLRAVE